jgi:hypothetical protein
VNALLDEHIEHVSNRIAALRSLQKDLRRLRSLCERTQVTKDCRILQSLAGSTRNPARSPDVQHRNSRLDKTHK